MRVQIQKWGNSLALRIPKAFAKETHIENNTVVDLSLDNDHLIISPINELEEYSLSAMLSDIDENNMHEAVDFGLPAGEEAL
ncbi:MAG: AbrB/MazE/SpoVT family DNA-binding domain-containing protein [Candidatus Marinimicrobia bacterium]|nr:AbrB/MazE/SpoVT family DNA-binding domain-containing protein [Candidatus Neomarinimicrobiota bacterium]